MGRKTSRSGGGGGGGVGGGGTGRPRRGEEDGGRRRQRSRASEARRGGLRAAVTMQGEREEHRRVECEVRGWRRRSGRRTAHAVASKRVPSEGGV